MLMGLGLMLVEVLPEGGFLYVYGTPVIPIIFTVLLYILYLALLFCYHNELQATPPQDILNSPNRITSRFRTGVTMEI
jgi:hypothetical protein